MSDTEIDSATLVARLAEGGGAGLTVLTPNSRLARELEAEVDACHLAAGRPYWEAADVLPFDLFVARCHEEIVYSPAGARAPVLLSDAAARLIWEEVVQASRWREGLLSAASTAALAAGAWDLAHEWRIAGALRGEAGSDDAEAFCDWAEDYQRRTARDGFTEAARLPVVVAGLLSQGAVALPRTLVLHAFDLVTPRQSDFLDACRKAGVQVETSNARPAAASTVTRIEVESPRSELEHAARWARARLEAGGPAPRIAVVVSDLAQRRREVVRVFGRAFAPAGEKPGEIRAPLYNLSLGESLDAYPLVDAALALLELASGTLEYDRASRLIRSPFIAGAETEAAERARLDAALRRIAPAAPTLNRLRTAMSQAVRREHAPECPRLIAVFDGIAKATRESARAPAHEWARRFTKVLDAAGFPGERILDSIEFQTLKKWREALGEFAGLGLVPGTWSGAEARSRLQRLCAETLFQPKSGQAPVQVLGLLESAGLAFDHLWICGLTEDVWPLSPRPHPLIPPALQRKAGIPQASPEKALEVDLQLTAAWKTAAPEVVFSTARADGDRELLASPLIADIMHSPVEALGIPEFAELRTSLFRAGGRKAISHRHDDSGPGVPAPLVKGGARILVDQAACPFRAFAHFRLDAHELERPEHGLGPLERGTLLHEMMGRVWEELKDHKTLVATDEAALEKLTLDAARFAIARVREDRPGRLDGRFRELEEQRLAQVAREWLDLEKGRAPFEVTLREEKMKLFAGNLQIDGRIDRMDRLEGGGLAVIDYKSGRASVASWLGEPPEDAQLPLYALAAGAESVRAVTFARMKTGDRGFAGLARDGETGIPGVTALEKHGKAGKRADTWAGLFEFWQHEVDALGDDFAAGDARVDPRQMLRTCERCDLKSLCRVHERLGALDEGEPFEEPTGDDEEDE